MIAQSDAEGWEALVSGRWVPCRVVERSRTGKRLIVRVELLPDDSAVALPTRFLIERRPHQVRRRL